MNTPYYPKFSKFSVNLQTDDDDDEDDAIMHQMVTAGMKTIAFPLLCHTAGILPENCADEMLRISNECNSLCGPGQERYLSNECAETTPLEDISLTCQQLLAPEYAFSDECEDYEDNHSHQMLELRAYLCQNAESPEKCAVDIKAAELYCQQECKINEEDCSALRPDEELFPNVTCGQLLEDTYYRKKLACDTSYRQSIGLLSYVSMASSNLISEEVYGGSEADMEALDIDEDKPRPPGRTPERGF